MRYKSKLISPGQVHVFSIVQRGLSWTSATSVIMHPLIKAHWGDIWKHTKLSHQAGCMSFLLSNLDSVGQGASLPFFSCPTHLTKVHVFLPLFPCTLHYICLHCICQHITAAYITHAYITPTPITSAYITSSYILSAFMYTPAYTYNVVQALSLSRWI